MRLFCYQFVIQIALSNKKNIYICHRCATRGRTSNCSEICECRFWRCIGNGHSEPCLCCSDEEECIVARGINRSCKFYGRTTFYETALWCSSAAGFNGHHERNIWMAYIARTVLSVVILPESPVRFLGHFFL